MMRDGSPLFQIGLKVSKLSSNDAILFSVGGGNLKKVSVNLIEAAIYAKKKSKIFGIVGKKMDILPKKLMKLL